jgi:hypothetical protein
MNMLGVLRSLKTKLLDEGGIDEIFSHLRNLVLATVVIAAGSYATMQPDKVKLFGFLKPELAGYGIEALGAILIGLNFLDGIYKLTRLGSHLLLKIALAVLYLLISIRLIYFVVLLRGG